MRYIICLPGKWPHEHGLFGPVERCRRDRRSLGVAIRALGADARCGRLVRNLPFIQTGFRFHRTPTGGPARDLALARPRRARGISGGLYSGQLAIARCVQRRPTNACCDCWPGERDGAGRAAGTTVSHRTQRFARPSRTADVFRLGALDSSKVCRNFVALYALDWNF